MINIKIDNNDLLDLLITRLKFWTTDDDVISLFTDMYTQSINDGVFDDIKLNVKVLIDNDYINYCSVIYKDDDIFEELNEIYKEQGLGNCSCKTDVANVIEAVDDTSDPTMFLIRQ